MKFFTLFFILLSISLASCIPCPNSCSSVGKCITSTGKCRCNNGFYGEDCSETIPERLGGWWIFFRVITLTAFSIVLLLSIAALAVRRKVEVDDKSNLSLFNARTLVLSELIILSLDIVLLFAIDPNGLHFIIPYPLVRIMFGLVFPLLSTILATVVCHWAEVYYAAVDRLRREAMLEKINSKYHPDVTLEDIIAKTKVFSRLKIPFIILNALPWIVQIIREALMISHKITTQHAFQKVWLTIYFLVYGSETFGFLYFGPKLVMIMPDSIKKKMVRITAHVCILSILFLLCWVLVTCIMSIPAVSPWWYFAGEIAFRMGVALICFMILSMFLKFGKKFPFIFPVNEKRNYAPKQPTPPVDVPQSA